ncbi:MAG: uracil-DNA glycosylase [Rickettsiaceae bacterium]|nr:uracil-DNA glycosylase [Rickettsiaceae bacterium]
MDKLQAKLNQLKWLKHAGIGYYCSEQKDSKNSLMKKLKIVPKANFQDKMPKIITEQIKPQPIKVKEESGLTANIAEARRLAESAKNLDELKTIVENFNGCALKNFATNTVFCDGQPNAEILLIGEAPGATEDKQGIPFCGESGKLLDKMLKTIGLDRVRNIYITNTIFWRPPANRRPTPEEIKICSPFVEKHIQLLAPKLIILIGGTAATALLGKKESITYIRENYYPYTNQYLKEPILTAALFHPAFLLRSPYKKKDTWFDLLKIRDYIQKKGIVI